MLLARLDALDEQRLQELCVEHCPESGTLDFKRGLPSTSDDEGKAEFLKDVCAFANSDGGDLVYGIADKNGGAEKVHPITSEAADAAKRRLGQVLDAKVEPRIQGLQFHPVEVTGGYVLILRVPASFDGPHRHQHKEFQRFVMRNGTHTSDLTYDQLRAAFDRTATLAERARQFVNDRTESILAGKTWRPMLKGPLCLAHLVPIAAMAGRTTIDVGALYSNSYTDFIFSDWGSASRTLNLDGLVIHPPESRKEPQTAYTQLFRSGAFEAVRYGGRLFSDEHQRVIPSTTITAFYREAAMMFLAAAKRFEYSGPAAFRCALLQIDGYEFGVGEQFRNFQKAYADRPNLVLPDVWIEDVAEAQDVDAIVRPMMNILWQAFDVERCLEYDKDGTWRARRW
jgi:hypothetical protein